MACRQVRFIVKEFLEEQLTRHLCTVDDDVVNSTFVLTNFFKLSFQHGAKTFDRISCKAQRKQFFLNCVLSLNESRRTVTFSLVGMLQILIKLFAVVQFGKNDSLEFVNLTCRHTGGTDVRAFVVFSHLLTGFFVQTVNQAVNDLVNLHRAVSDLFSIFQNGNNRRRFSITSARSCSMLTLSLCWLEMTTASTRTGLLFSSYSTVT